MSKFTDRLATSGILVHDPTKVIHTISDTSTSYDTINTGPFVDPWKDPIIEIKERISKLETANKFLRLKILSIEGKFSQEEVTNIRKMLISEDEASRTLAESIIDNA